MNRVEITGDWAGRVIDGRFKLLQWLGASERSGVFLTELEGDRAQKAAIKLISVDGGDADAYVAGWAAAASLSHPHLMRLFHTGRCEIDHTALVYAVMEYAEEVLAEIIPRRPLTPREAKEMLDPVLDGLSYLHGKGFVHGRLKPANILVVDDQLKLSSDGLYVAGELKRHSQTRSIYDAPEFAAQAISPAADVWSLGVTLVEALTQHPPVWDRSRHRDPVVPEFFPQPLAAIALECLRSAPARRCTISDVKAHLGTEGSLPVAESKTGRSAPGRFIAAALIAAVLVLFAVIAVFYLRSHQARPSPPTEEQRQVPAPAAASPPTPVPENQTPKGVPVKGTVAERVLPDVPQTARETIQGKVEVTIRVAADPGGEVSDAALESPGPSKYFANQALEAARHWKFKPAQADGRPVSSVWKLRFEFRQTGVEVIPVEVSP